MFLHNKSINNIYIYIYHIIIHFIKFNYCNLFLNCCSTCIKKTQILQREKTDTKN